jgi:hypothetical protein
MLPWRYGDGNYETNPDPTGCPLAGQTVNKFSLGIETLRNRLDRLYLTGKYDLAMDKIEFLLTIPGDISIPFLKINPMYDKLRPLPRFQKILATEYKTNY